LPSLPSLPCLPSLPAIPAARAVDWEDREDWEDWVDLCNSGDRLPQDFDHAVDLRLTDYQRGRETDGVPDRMGSGLAGADACDQAPPPGLAQDLAAYLQRGGLRGFVRDQLDATHQPHSPHIPDHRQLAQRLGPLLQTGAHRRAALHQLFPLQDVEVGEPDRTARGMTRIGRGVHEAL